MMSILSGSIVCLTLIILYKYVSMYVYYLYCYIAWSALYYVVLKFYTKDYVPNVVYSVLDLEGGGVLQLIIQTFL